MFDVPIATGEHVQVNLDLQDHDILMIILGHESVMKELDDAVQSTSGSLKPNIIENRGASANEYPLVYLPIQHSVKTESISLRMGKVRVSIGKRSSPTLPDSLGLTSDSS